MEHQKDITHWIDQGANILDLGCGDGTLLARLQQSHAIYGYGVEKDPKQIIACLAKDVNVLQFDLDQGLSRFNDASFDLVILNHTLQALHKPHMVLQEMLRVGKKSIVVFPNFSHWYNRWYLAWKGKMPVSKVIPYSWYATTNIHHCTCKDFENLCSELGFIIKDSILVTARNRVVQRTNPFANLLASSAMYLICKE